MSVSRRFFLKSGALLSSLPLAATVAHAADPAATASRQVGPAPVRTTPVSDYIVDGQAQRAILIKKSNRTLINF